MSCYYSFTYNGVDSQVLFDPEGPSLGTTTRDTQGVVTYMLPVEAFMTVIKFFDQQKVCLIACSSPSEALDCLISKGQRSNCCCAFLITDF